MVYAPRKLVYPVFTVAVLVAFISMLYLVFLSQSIEVLNPSVSVVGADVVLKMTLVNTSNHEIDGVNVLIKNNSGERLFFLKGDGKSSLAPGEKYDFVASFPLSENLKYNVIVSAPFNKQVPLDFTLEPSTIDPVSVVVYVPFNLKVGQQANYSVKLCNVSNSDLPEVNWIESAEQGLFKEVFFERSISLRILECKTIHLILTPAKAGELTITFTMRVGSIEKKISKVLTAVE
jgi:hypothetical protein